jgi:hypothetical protein
MVREREREEMVGVWTGLKSTAVAWHTLSLKIMVSRLLKATGPAPPPPPPDMFCS